MFKSVPSEAIQIASKGELATCKKNAAGQCELSNPCTMLQGMFTVNKEHAFQIGVSFQGYRVEFIPFDNLLCMMQHWVADLAVTSSAKVRFGQCFSHYIFVILFEDILARLRSVTLTFKGMTHDHLYAVVQPHLPCFMTRHACGDDVCQCMMSYERASTFVSKL